MKFYCEQDDCQWLRDTALRDLKDVPTFGSFFIQGNEDCPELIDLYSDADPDHDAPVIARYVLASTQIYYRTI